MKKVLLLSFLLSLNASATSIHDLNIKLSKNLNQTSPTKINPAMIYGGQDIAKPVIAEAHGNTWPGSQQNFTV